MKKQEEKKSKTFLEIIQERKERIEKLLNVKK